MTRGELADFLLARIAEDEEAANAAAQHDWIRSQPVARWRYEEDESQRGDGNGKGSVANGVGQYVANPTWHHQGAHVARHDPVRVLAECEAKRAIVWFMRGGFNTDDVEYWTLHEALQHLALPYADHPDYDQAWRP